MITRDSKDNEDVCCRYRKEGNAFGALRKSLFSNPSITYETKGAAYCYLILPILLYGAESWCLTEKLFNQLRTFYHGCARSMHRVNRRHVYLHRISSNELLENLNILSIDVYITRRQLSWFGHVSRMSFDRIPRKLLSSWVKSRRPKGAPEFTFSRGMYKALRRANICKDDWFVLAKDQFDWCKMINSFT